MYPRHPIRALSAEAYDEAIVSRIRFDKEKYSKTFGHSHFYTRDEEIRDLAITVSRQKQQAAGGHKVRAYDAEAVDIMSPLGSTRDCAARANARLKSPSGYNVVNAELEVDHHQPSLPRFDFVLKDNKKFYNPETRRVLAKYMHQFKWGVLTDHSNLSVLGSLNAHEEGDMRSSGKAESGPRMLTQRRNRKNTEDSPLPGALRERGIPAVKNVEIKGLDGKEERTKQQPPLADRLKAKQAALQEEATSALISALQNIETKYGNDTQPGKSRHSDTQVSVDLGKLKGGTESDASGKEIYAKSSSKSVDFCLDSDHLKYYTNADTLNPGLSTTTTTVSGIPKDKNGKLQAAGAQAIAPLSVDTSTTTPLPSPVKRQRSEKEIDELRRSPSYSPSYALISRANSQRRLLDAPAPARSPAFQSITEGMTDEERMELSMLLLPKDRPVLKLSHATPLQLSQEREITMGFIDRYVNKTNRRFGGMFDDVEMTPATRPHFPERSRIQPHENITKMNKDLAEKQKQLVGKLSDFSLFHTVTSLVKTDLKNLKGDLEQNDIERQKHALYLANHQQQSMDEWKPQELTARIEEEEEEEEEKEEKRSNKRPIDGDTGCDGSQGRDSSSCSKSSNSSEGVVEREANERQKKESGEKDKSETPYLVRPRDRALRPHSANIAALLKERRTATTTATTTTSAADGTVATSVDANFHPFHVKEGLNGAHPIESHISKEEDTESVTSQSSLATTAYIGAAPAGIASATAGVQLLLATNSARMPDDQLPAQNPAMLTEKSAVRAAINPDAVRFQLDSDGNLQEIVLGSQKPRPKSRSMGDHPIARKITEDFRKLAKEKEEKEAQIAAEKRRLKLGFRTESSPAYVAHAPLPRPQHAGTGNVSLLTTNPHLKSTLSTVQGDSDLAKSNDSDSNRPKKASIRSLKDVVRAVQLPKYLEKLQNLTKIRAVDASRELLALRSLFDDHGGQQWVCNTGWQGDGDIGRTGILPVKDWHGVNVNVEGYVFELDLRNNNLIGRFPDVVSEFRRLECIVLDNNQLEGPLPEYALRRLDKLEFLSANCNRLSGSLQLPILDHMISLKEIWLGDNQLTGTITEEIAKLVNLTHLCLYKNKLTGPIPEGLGKLSKLEYLSLGDNQLTGSVPEWFIALQRLRFLALYNNRLSGPEPRWLKILPRVQTVEYYGNPFDPRPLSDK